uniref:Mammary transforming protein n=1 Tax=Mus musculus TaxID=10090 RepID=Q61910_MOUSE|nr:mammary transforming protein [Mus musculus domesticus]prf//2021425A MAT1 gene [Mus musculus]
MYIKPALPCLPFFVVFSINLLSRPEREWEGMPQKGSGRAKLLQSPNRKHISTNHNKCYIYM